MLSILMIEAFGNKDGESRTMTGIERASLINETPPRVLVSFIFIDYIAVFILYFFLSQ
jgi:hypothetical protein